jgi:hypothetical protein
MIPPPVSNRRHRLFGVSAVAPDDVWTVGEARNVVGPLFALIYHWDGESWSHIPSPADELLDAHLRDVVAIAADDVWAVGSVGSQPLFMHFDGDAWAIADHPLPDLTHMGPITAVASDDVWAVAQSSTYPQTPTFVHFDGLAWSTVTAPEVPGADGGMNLNGGLVAVGPCEVWAVGSTTSGGWNSTATVQLSEGRAVGVSDGAAAPVAGGMRIVPHPVRGMTRITPGVDAIPGSEILIVDVTGRTVRRLAVDVLGGDRPTTWDGDDERGLPVAPGGYIIQVRTVAGVHGQKVIVGG